MDWNSEKSVLKTRRFAAFGVAALCVAALFGEGLGYPGLSGVGGCSATVGFTPAVNGGTLSSN